MWRTGHNESKKKTGIREEWKIAEAEAMGGRGIGGKRMENKRNRACRRGR